MYFFGVFNLKSEQVAGIVIELSYLNAVNLLGGNSRTLSNFFYKNFHQEIIWHEYSIFNRFNLDYL